MKKVSIIPARMDSKRLPGKPLREIGGFPMLHFLIERMRQVSEIDAVVIATTERSCDKPLIQWAYQTGVDVYCGDLEDVLGRFTAAAQHSGADIVAKCNGDNPLLAPEVITSGFQEMTQYGYEFVTGKNTYTGLPMGLGAEIIRYDTLERLNQLVKEPIHRAGITTFIFDNSQSFNWAPIPVKAEWVAPELSFTVDTEEDFKRMSYIINALVRENPSRWNIEKIISTYRELRQ
jgi:spore coat polysaccharide biosynthesis protein SpsF